MRVVRNGLPVIEKAGLFGNLENKIWGNLHGTSKRDLTLQVSGSSLDLVRDGNLLEKEIERKFLYFAVS